MNADRGAHSSALVRGKLFLKQATRAKRPLQSESLRRKVVRKNGTVCVVVCMFTVVDSRGAKFACLRTHPGGDVPGSGLQRNRNAEFG